MHDADDTDTSTTPESRARLAYAAYAKAVDHLDKDGRPLPEFDTLRQRQRTGWQASARIIWELATTGRASL